MLEKKRGVFARIPRHFVTNLLRKKAKRHQLLSLTLQIESCEICKDVRFWNLGYRMVEEGHEVDKGGNKDLENQSMTLKIFKNSSCLALYADKIHSFSE